MTANIAGYWHSETHAKSEN